MASKAYHDITFHEDGSFGFIFDDAIAEIAAEIAKDGALHVRRASDVEPVSAEDGRLVGWSAIMRPWAGGKDLGVFPTRQAALDAEVDHLERVSPTWRRRR